MLAWVMLVGFLVIAPIAAIRGIPPQADGGDAAWLVVASVGSVAGLGLIYAALRRGKVSIVAPISATEGAIAALVAVAFGEHLAVGTGIALAVTAFGVILASTGTDSVKGDGSRMSIALAILAASLFGMALYASGRVGPSLGAAVIILGARALGVTVILLPLLARRRLRISGPRYRWSSSRVCSSSSGTPRTSSAWETAATSPYRRCSRACSRSSRVYSGSCCSASASARSSSPGSLTTLIGVIALSGLQG